MKIVSRTELLKLPIGIVYSYYRYHGFEGLYEKGRSLSNDWIYADMLDNVGGSDERSDIIFAAEEGAEFHMDLECGSRDGAFNDGDMFAIYDKRDIDSLVRHLEKLRDSYPSIE